MSAFKLSQLTNTQMSTKLWKELCLKIFCQAQEMYGGLSTDSELQKIGLASLSLLVSFYGMVQAYLGIGLEQNA